MAPKLLRCRNASKKKSHVRRHNYLDYFFHVIWRHLIQRIQRTLLSIYDVEKRFFSPKFARKIILRLSSEDVGKYTELEHIKNVLSSLLYHNTVIKTILTKGTHQICDQHHLSRNLIGSSVQFFGPFYSQLQLQHC